MSFREITANVTSHVTRVLQVCATAAVLGCGDGGGADSEPTKDAVHLEAWPAALDVALGVPASARIGISRPDGGNDAIVVTPADVPAGVSAVIAPMSVFGDSATLSLTLVADATPGLYTMRLTGAGPARADASLSIPVSVQSGPFAMRAAPVAFDLTSGGPAASGTITIVRSAGFVGDVLLQLQSHPVSVFAGVSPTGNRDVWNLVVDPGRATDATTFTLVISGSTTIGAPSGSVGTLVVPVRLRTP